MKRRMASLGLLLIAAILVNVPACSSRTQFPNETEAKSALVGKSAREVVAKLGPPDSVSSATAPETPGKYTEYWKYSRMVRDRSGELQAMNIYFLRGRVVMVGMEK